MGDQMEWGTVDYFKNFDIYSKWRASEGKKSISNQWLDRHIFSIGSKL